MERWHNLQLLICCYAVLLSPLLQSNGGRQWQILAQVQPDELEPEFLSQLSNITVAQGRDVSFTCVVNNLGQYRVAWIKSDSKAILGIHTHMVSLNQRLSVTHNGHNTWKLHISHVQLNDSGSYMCQVNTDPMKSQSGYLDVVVPPDILNYPDQNLEDSITNEGGTITLSCSATGVPQPTVIWRREGGKDIILRTESRDKQVVKTVEGERLVLGNIHRTDMGGYLCIASNGIPPSVSKRFDVHVNFAPTIKAVNQLVGAPVGREVTLECIVEVYPKPLNGWYRNEGNQKLHNDNKYNITEGIINMYTWHLNLTIRQLTRADFGAYSCSSVNALGKNDARIRLQELRLPAKPTTTSIPYVNTTPKPRHRKPPANLNKSLNEVLRVKDSHSNQHSYSAAANEIFQGISDAGSNTTPNNHSNPNNHYNNHNGRNSASISSSSSGGGGGGVSDANSGSINSFHIGRGSRGHSGSHAHELHFNQRDGTGGGGASSNGRTSNIIRSSNLHNLENSLSNEAEVYTQLSPRNGELEKTHKKSAVPPTPLSPWIVANGGSSTSYKYKLYSRWQTADISLHLSAGFFSAIIYLYLRNMAPN